MVLIPIPNLAGFDAKALNFMAGDFGSSLA